MEHQEMVKPLLLEIHPRIEVSAICPNCQSDNIDVQDHLFEGIHVLVDCTCKACATKFYHTAPIAHDAVTPISVSHDGKYFRYDPGSKVWLAQPLIDALMKPSCKISPKISKKNLVPLKNTVVILNCLDDCFGHSYVKLLNARMLMSNYPEHSLVLLITPNLEWLVPNGVSELWIVEASMSVMSRQVTTLQSFVKAELSKMSRCYLSTAKVFHDLSKIDFEPFLKTKPFDLSQFDKIPKTVTFVLREDRYWHKNKLDDLLNRVFVKLKIKKNFQWYFIRRQARLVERSILLIKKSRPAVQIYITGIGTAGGFQNEVTDLRATKVTSDIEKQWCDVYSKSHVVIGVHGSNMLIPTSLSAGFIDLLPPHKIPHLGEDTVLRHAGRYAILLGRHVDVYSSPSLVAEHVVDMLRFSEVGKLMNG